MNWCVPHWGKLVDAVRERGLDKFGAQNSTEAIKAMSAQLEGSTETFDPLMGSWTRINLNMANSLKKQGRGDELLQLRCPLCVLIEDGQPRLVDNWINGVTDEALKYAIDQKLIKEH